MVVFLNYSEFLSFVCVYLYISREREKEREREGGKKDGRERGRERVRERDRLILKNWLSLF